MTWDKLVRPCCVFSLFLVSWLVKIENFFEKTTQNLWLIISIFHHIFISPKTSEHLFGLCYLCMVYNIEIFSDLVKYYGLLTFLCGWRMVNKMVFIIFYMCVFILCLFFFPGWLVLFEKKVDEKQRKNTTWPYWGICPVNLRFYFGDKSHARSRCWLCDTITSRGAYSFRFNTGLDVALLLTWDKLVIKQVAYLWKIPGLVIIWRSETGLGAVFKITQREAPRTTASSLPGSVSTLHLYWFNLIIFIYSAIYKHDEMQEYTFHVTILHNDGTLLQFYVV